MAKGTMHNTVLADGCRPRPPPSWIKCGVSRTARDVLGLFSHPVSDHLQCGQATPLTSLPRCSKKRRGAPGIHQSCANGSPGFLGNLETTVILIYAARPYTTESWEPLQLDTAPFVQQSRDVCPGTVGMALKGLQTKLMAILHVYNTRMCLYGY